MSSVAIQRGGFASLPDAIITVVKRLTIRADEELLRRLRAAARREGLPLAAVVRQGLEWRAARSEWPLAFIGAGASDAGSRDIARRAGDLAYEPDSWRSPHEASPPAQSCSDASQWPALLRRAGRRNTLQANQEAM
jgi:predicted transcriptional regulator